MSDHDCVLVTGDLATRGLTPDLRLAYDYILSPASVSNGYLGSDNRPTLSMAGRPIILAPGNHDRFKNFVGTPNSIEFENVFASHWSAGPRGVQANRLHGKSKLDLYIVSADFTLEDTSCASPPIPLYAAGQGRCYPSVVAELIRVTTKIKTLHPDVGVIWVSHFPPSLNEFTVDGTLKLIDDSGLISAAKHCNIKYIISGHVHCPALIKGPHTTLIIGGTLCAVPSANGNWINSLAFNYSNGSLALQGVEMFRFNKTLKDFELA